MPLSINSIAPDFKAHTTEGMIQFHDWLGDGWCVLFSHPKDFTPVCTTEIGAVAKVKDEFDRRGVRSSSVCRSTRLQSTCVGPATSSQQPVRARTFR